MIELKSISLITTNMKILLLSRNIIWFLLFVLFTDVTIAQKQIGQLSYTVSAEQAPTHSFRVQFKCEGIVGDSFDLKMPVWMPGYYQIMDYAKNLDSFSVADDKGKEIKWRMVNKNSWRIYPNRSKFFLVKFHKRIGSITFPFELTSISQST